jgi:hypothetical protein
MGIIKKYIQPVEVQYKCDVCGGNVIPTGEVLTSDPLKYKHKCNKCNKEYTFKEIYPYTVNEYRTIGSDMFGSNLNIFNKL